MMKLFFRRLRYIWGLSLALLLTACATQQSSSVMYQANQKKAKIVAKQNESTQFGTTDVDYLGLILAAEQATSGSVRSVLAEARRMTLFEKALVQGSCWDYLDKVWTRAGVPRVKRQVVFKSKQQGPFASVSTLQPGDWLYHINYSYKNIEHSGMFIGWLDKEKRLGVTLSYAGGNRREPARYRVYDLSGVYQITRAR